MSNEMIRVFALPHLGAEREIIVMKEKGQNVHAFPPYAKKSLAVLHLPEQGPGGEVWRSC